MAGALIETFLQLEAFSRLVEALSRREFPDGREAMVTPRMYNAIITVGQAGQSFYQDDW